MNLNMNCLPHFLTGNFREFISGESHVTRTSDYDVLILMLGGTLIFLEDGVRRELGAGDWYIQQAGRRQEGSEPSAMPSYYYLHFHGEFWQGPGLPLQGKFQPESYLTLIRKLELVSKNGSSLMEQSRWFLELLLSLSQEAAPPPGRFQQLRDYLSLHYTEPLKIRDLAMQFGYSEDYLIKLFKKHAAVTPHQYLAQLRLKQAKEMLNSTDLTLQSIADQCGYSDTSLLYRAFVRNMGVSPDNWKRRRSQ